jgi:hypothetical protein
MMSVFDGQTFGITGGYETGEDLEWHMTCEAGYGTSVSFVSYDTALGSSVQVYDTTANGATVLDWPSDFNVDAPTPGPPPGPPLSSCGDLDGTGNVDASDLLFMQAA